MRGKGGDMARVMRVGVCVVAALLLCAAASMAARTSQASFDGLAFGTRRAGLSSFMTLKTTGTVEYAVNLSERYRVNGQAPAVFYAFAGGRLFAVYVRLTDVISRADMAKRLTAEFGKPAMAVEGGVEVLRWRRGDLKIKLKYDPNGHTLKLGYYSIRYGEPALGTLADPEAIDIDALARPYEKNKISKDVTLPKVPATKGYSPYDDNAATRSGRGPGW